MVSVVPGPGGGGRCHCSHGHWSPHCTLTLDRSQVNISSVCLVLKKLWMFCISMASHSHSKNERKERGGYLTQCPGPGMMRHVRLVAPCAPWPLLTGTLWRWRVRTNFRPSLIPSQQPACPCPAPTIHPVAALSCANHGAIVHDCLSSLWFPFHSLWSVDCPCCHRHCCLGCGLDPTLQPIGPKFKM